LTSKNWFESNQEYLAACIRDIKAQIKKQTCSAENQPPDEPLKSPTWVLSKPPAINNLCMLFGLSKFERDIILLCAAVELDSEGAQLVAALQGTPSFLHPTVAMALSFLRGAQWSSLTPASPLRRFRIVEAIQSEALSLKDTRLRINERVLNYIIGTPHLEPQLAGIVKPVAEAAELSNSHKRLAEKVVHLWKDGEGKIPLVQIWGAEESTKLTVAKSACARVGLNLWQMDGEFTPAKFDEIETLIQLWRREAALLESGLYISAEDAEPATQKTVVRIIDGIPGPVFLGVREPWAALNLQNISLRVKKPERAEQHKLWKAALSSSVIEPDEREITKITAQFNLGAQAIQELAAVALRLSENPAQIYRTLWDTCRTASRPRLSELAQEVNASAEMDDLVLPDREKRLLCEIAIHVAQRSKVYGEWGFEAKSSRGLGIAALFSGPSGTGKTMAAEVLANELQLDLYCIDLSSVVSKYIGETEKNLRKVFDAAEGGGAILFFDEADALFGKRSEVKDSHDRYANIEVSYLLQRMENYRGLAILSTNMKKALDPAFIRRLKFIVEFPFPDQKSREEIWRHAFPSNTPTEALNVERLAQLNLTGGNIRNIAMYSAFLAAHDGTPVRMNHIKRATQVEYDKLERPLIPSELEGW
jgi:SpoVK/Ycf46/Vps4 family AAA+-type ATPase